MPNPWLQIPLADYEGHMSSPEVGQSAVLADLFAEVLDRRRPASVAVLGVAGGNGLDRIDPSITRRVVGVDINAGYLDQARGRYPAFEFHCADLAALPFSIEPVDLVHAALVFEHAGTGACLDNARSLLAPGGALSIVLQLPGGKAVSDSPYPSLQLLQADFRLIDPQAFTRTLLDRGLACVAQSQRMLPQAKSFWAATFV